MTSLLAMRRRQSKILGLLITISSAFMVVAPTAQAQRRRAPTPAQRQQAGQLFAQGAQHYGAGRLDEALDHFLRAWRIAPNPEMAYNIARTYERMGDPTHGIQFYRHYLSRAAPDASERTAVEARIVELQAVAERQRNQIVQVPPSNDELSREARTFFQRGVVMYRRRNYQAAMAAFTAAYNFARLPEVVYNLAVTAERLERRQDAIDYFREYQRSLPRDSPERAMIRRRVEQLRSQVRR